MAKLSERFLESVAQHDTAQEVATCMVSSLGQMMHENIQDDQLLVDLCYLDLHILSIAERLEWNRPRKSFEELRNAICTLLDLVESRFHNQQL